MENTVSIPIQSTVGIKLKTWQIFLGIVVINLLLSFAVQNFIMTNRYYYSLLGNQMESNRIDEYIKVIRKLSVWGYLSQPVILWLKIALISFLVQLPLMLRYIEIPFKIIFRSVALANLSLIAANIITVVYLVLVPSNEITQSSFEFNPLSITVFLDKAKFITTAWNFLSSINAFEGMWIYILYNGLLRAGKLTKEDSLLLALGVWTATAVFQFALTSYLNKIF